jgi:RND family efflux transporter MFP subunit
VRARAILPCLLLPLILSGCRQTADVPAEEDADATPVLVTTETARQQTFRVTISGPGTVSPDPSGDMTVYPTQMGRIAQLPVHEGDTVAEGDVLVRFEYGTTDIDLRSHEMELGTAQARLDTARAQQTKVSAMFDRGYASRNELDEANAAIAAAELEVNRARAQIQAATEAAERAIVKTKFPGVVTKLFHSEGDLVNSTIVDPVLRVVDPSRLEVAMHVPTPDLAHVVIGQTATIVSANGAEPGTVLSRPAPDDLRAATQEVRIGFATPTTLAADSPVQVEILVAERPGVVTLPEAAVLDGGDGQWYVMVAGADGRAERRDVRLGLRSGGRVEIAAGVTPGDRGSVKDANTIAQGTLIQ